MNVLLVAAGVAIVAYVVYRVLWQFFFTDADRYGKVVYRDAEGAKMLRHKLGVHGKPDAIIHVKNLFTNEHRPWEIKTTVLRNGKVPIKHVAQLAAEGLLVEAEYGKYPEYGYLQYTSHRVIKVKLGQAARGVIADSLAAMRARRPEPTKAIGTFACTTCKRLGQCPIRTG